MQDKVHSLYQTCPNQTKYWTTTNDTEEQLQGHSSRSTVSDNLFHSWPRWQAEPDINTIIYILAFRRHDKDCCSVTWFNVWFHFFIRTTQFCLSNVGRPQMYIEMFPTTAHLKTFDQPTHLKSWRASGGELECLARVLDLSPRKWSIFLACC
jgi:hypothetical protein